ncbi:hypothetical protein R1sor_015730 [Riccia sorocarpa]|uniref:BTB domain-containing protein n=1 Tax=Riccia sorocarpa TaxID=122646 RepID=A0ABD3HEZ7_9MARC
MVPKFWPITRKVSNVLLARTLMSSRVNGEVKGSCNKLSGIKRKQQGCWCGGPHDSRFYRSLVQAGLERIAPKSGGQLRDSLVVMMDPDCLFFDPFDLTECDVDLRKMVNNAEFSSVTFVCEDGVSVHGCRMLLAARSLFFKGLLLGEMKEALNASVELPTVSSSVLILVMKFLHTGKLVYEDLKPPTSASSPSVVCRRDWNFLVKTIVAARYFMLDLLEEAIIEELEQDLRIRDYSDEDSLILLAKRLSLLHEYPSLLTLEGIERMCGSMAADLKTHDLSPATLYNLSQAAFYSYLEKTQDKKGLQPGASSLDEYLRVRQILTWCVVSTSSPENLDRKCLPGPEVALELIYSRTRDEHLFDFSHGRTEFVSKISEELLKPLLEFVDFLSIPGKLLFSVIEPLDIIKPEKLASVFRAHAMKSTDGPVPNVWHMLVGNRCTWKIPEKDERTLTFTVRRETSSLTVTAIAGLVMRTSETLEWSINVMSEGALEKQSMANFEFGFIALKFGDPFPQDSLGIGPLSADLRCSAMRIGADLKSVCSYSHARCIGQGTINGSPFQCRTPLKVIVHRDKGPAQTITTGKNGSMLFHFFAPKDELLYLAIYFRITGSDEMFFRPHYDQVTVVIDNIVGHDNLAVVKTPSFIPECDPW